MCRAALTGVLPKGHHFARSVASMLASTESTLHRAKAPFHFLPGGSFCMEPRHSIHFPRCGKLRRIASVCCLSNLHRLLVVMPGFYSSKRAPFVVTSLTTVVTSSPSHTSILTWSRADTVEGNISGNSHLFIISEGPLEEGICKTPPIA